MPTNYQYMSNMGVLNGRVVIESRCDLSLAYFGFKVTTHSNNRNSKSSREVILGSVRLLQSVILRNYDMFSTDSNARYAARW